MRLVIQIPCFNEEETIGQTLADLPREIPGIDEIIVLIIDDGSVDETSRKAEELGVHYIVRFSTNQGLATAHMKGLEACLRLNADLVVNTDADNQYVGEDIKKLVTPILLGKADLVVGDRQTDTIAHFSRLKRWLQKWGSHIVRKLSGTKVNDTTSGFRAMNRKTISSLFVHNRFSYTLESIIQAGSLGLTIENVAVRTNAELRESRLFSSIPQYIGRNIPIILSSYTMYWPLKTFGFLAMTLFIFGLVLGIRFLYFFIQQPEASGHIQSLQVGVGAIVMSFVVALMSLLGDLLARNRRLNEEILRKIRVLEVELDNKLPKEGEVIGGLYRTNAKFWKSSKNIR
jgi:glycosyltransferase involved in cell wall biosynthesis